MWSSDVQYWCCENIVYAILCTYGTVHMLDMWCCVHIVLCACWICCVMYIWFYVHAENVVLCTYGVVCMIVNVVLCACGAMYMLYI